MSSAASTVKIVITPDGALRFVYRDELQPLLAVGRARVDRASHVEPSYLEKAPAGVAWRADLSPVTGPSLGPFSTRQAALDAELAWLNANLGRVRRRVP